MAVNARGPMLLCKHAIPHMIAAGGGSIIHSSSGFGTLGESTLTAYGASKAALINLSRFIATQYGRQKIRSNVIVIRSEERRVAKECDSTCISRWSTTT